MSGVVTIPITLPYLTPLAAPMIAASAAAAAVSLGFAAVRAYNKAKACNSIAIDANNTEDITAGLSLDQALAFEKDGVTVIFARDSMGQVAVRVEGEQSDAELRAIGEKVAQALVQQYAYHRLVTEMKARGMAVVEESVEADGTVHLKARVYQG